MTAMRLVVGILATCSLAFFAFGMFVAGQGLLRGCIAGNGCIDGIGLVSFFFLFAWISGLVLAQQINPLWLRPRPNERQIHRSHPLGITKVAAARIALQVFPFAVCVPLMLIDFWEPPSSISDGAVWAWLGTAILALWVSLILMLRRLTVPGLR